MHAFIMLKRKKTGRQFRVAPLERNQRGQCVYVVTSLIEENDAITQCLRFSVKSLGPTVLDQKFSAAILLELISAVTLFHKDQETML